MHTPENVKRRRLYESPLAARRRLTWADATVPKAAMGRTGGLPKAVALDQSQLLEENVHLKQLFSSLQQDNLRLKKHVESLERQLKKSPSSECVIATAQPPPRELKDIVRSFKQQLLAKDRELWHLRQSMSATRLAALERDKEQLKAECAQLHSIVAELKASVDPDTVDALKENVRRLQAEVEELRQQQLTEQTEFTAFAFKTKPSMRPLALPALPQTQVALDRLLNKELCAKDSARLEGFFSRLSTQLKANNWTHKEFAKYLLTYGRPTYSCDELYSLLAAKHLTVPWNELRAVCDLLQSEDGVSVSDLYESLEAYEVDSDKSSDVSSPPTTTNYAASGLCVWGKPEGVQDVTDLVTLLAMHEPQEALVSRFSELPTNVSAEDLHKLFREKLLRIEDGADRNKLVEYLLKSRDSETKELVVERLKGICFGYENNGSEPQVVNDFLCRYQDFILDKCQQTGNGESIQWVHLATIVSLICELTQSQYFELKKRCFAFEHSLHCIPYRKLIAEAVQFDSNADNNPKFSSK